MKGKVKPGEGGKAGMRRKIGILGPAEGQEAASAGAAEEGGRTLKIKPKTPQKNPKPKAGISKTPNFPRGSEQVTAAAERAKIAWNRPKNPAEGSRGRFRGALGALLGHLGRFWGIWGWQPRAAARGSARARRAGATRAGKLGLQKPPRAAQTTPNHPKNAAGGEKLRPRTRGVKTPLKNQMKSGKKAKNNPRITQKNPIFATPRVSCRRY